METEAQLLCTGANLYNILLYNHGYYLTQLSILFSNVPSWFFTS